MASDMPLTKVELSDDELLALDGACSEAVQAEIEGAKTRRRLAANYDAPASAIYFVSVILRAAVSGGQLIRQSTVIGSCACCGRLAGYATRKRSSRAGPKGSIDLSKPLSLSAIEYVPRFVRVMNYSSTAACRDCVAIIDPILTAELADARAQIPNQLCAPGRPDLRKFDRRRCTVCGWEGREDQMRLLPALMGGTYHGECPGCRAKNEPFGPTIIESIDGFEIVEVRRGE